VITITLPPVPLPVAEGSEVLEPVPSSVDPTTPLGSVPGAASWACAASASSVAVVDAAVAVVVSLRELKCPLPFS
jgi:hypothetical protein